MIRVGIYGGAGYTAGELIRLLVHHPEVRLEWVHSNSQAGKPITAVHEGLLGDIDLCFSDTCDLTSIDYLFLCQGHGQSTAFWAEHKRPEGLRVIDLAQDFRDESEGYVYGLPELQRERIKESRLVANPGCFATAIQLGLLPLAKAGALVGDIVITAITGSTGAGVKPGATTHFSWRADNLSVYKAFEHQHLLEIRRNLSSLQLSLPEISFIPVRGNMARGIMATTVVTCTKDIAEVEQMYRDFYADAPFTHVTLDAIDLKQVTGTNKALIHLKRHGDKLLIVSMIDNLLKGASGQAMQNMNLMAGFDEQMGLRLKATAF